MKGFTRLKKERTAKPTTVVFDVTKDVDLSPEEAWEAIIDWEGHSDWVPFTHVDQHDETHFTAWSGLGASGWGKQFALEDNMEATSMQFDEVERHGTCVVQKTGPYLFGTTVIDVVEGPEPGMSTIHWHEEVDVKHLPKTLSAPVGKVSKVVFSSAMNRMERKVCASMKQE